MKKRLISLVAAAALVGGIATVSAPVSAQAGTVAVKGDTQVQLYGALKFTADWASRTNGLTANTAFKSRNNNVSDRAQNKLNFQGFTMNGAGTKFGFNFSNKDANLSGKLEIGTGTAGVNLRHAYIKHTFDNGLYVLVGQTDNTFEANYTSFNMLPNGIAGLNGAAPRSPQVAVGGKFDIADTASLDFKFAFMNSNYATYGAGLSQNRRTFPTIGLNVGVNFETGFGAPARVYGGVVTENDKILNINPATWTETSKTGVGYTFGIVLPVSMVTVQSEYAHAKGMNALAGVATTGALSTPPSYWWNGTTNSIETTKYTAWNLEAKITPMACVSVAAGYGHLKFKNGGFAANQIKKNSTVFVNASIKTTKYTTLMLEYDHIKTKAYDPAATAANPITTSYSGNSYFMAYTYSF
ncbi:hypothetical protein [Hippea sp. KM1]|uniref:hypothetical protein n=1 Tax=Hippea sp. KM1 TaxID=944481 RepID=UPI00046CDB33|nr:hypothetical protein [Hippea sp. KM1]